MNKRKIKLRLMALILCTSVLTACSSSSKTVTTNQTANTNNSSAKASFIVTSDMITYEKDDYYTDWKNENPNYLELTGNSASLKGTGASVKGNKITITAAGVYVLSGKLSDGQVIVDVQHKGTVKLVLNGAEINSSDASPIYVENAGKAIISIQEGTENIIADGEKYAAVDTAAGEPNAAIFSKANLSINGSGSLTVKGNYNNGITSKDDLKITGGNITINAKDDGMMGRDMLVVKDGSVKIKAGGDGIKSTNDKDASKGFIGLQGGTYEIESGADGIQAETSILIADGKYTIVTGGGNVMAPQKANEEAPGKPNGQQNTNTTTKTTTAEKKSAKAVKAASDISVTGGSFIIDSADDSIHSSNSVNISGGDFTITSGDDGIHADTAIKIKDGKIIISKSYEGIESESITFDGGETRVIASDDGINAAGGADGSSINGRPGQNNFSSSGNYTLNINGGYISVESSGDGLDANGAIYMNGGTVIVSGPTANNNGALDYDKEFIMKGGYLVTAGSSGMAQAPTDTSSQYSIAMSFSTAQKAGTLVALKESKGTTIATFAPPKQYQTVVISSPELKKGGEYTLYTGGSSTGTLKDGLYNGGDYNNGTKVVSFTISNSSTWLNESGITTPRSGGPGGQGSPRGQRGADMPPNNGNPATSGAVKTN